MMCECVATARTPSTIIANDKSCNHMRQRILLHNRRNERFGVNEPNWLNIVSTPNYQCSNDKNHQTVRANAERFAPHFPTDNWINIGRAKPKQTICHCHRSPPSSPSPRRRHRCHRSHRSISITTHFRREHIRTNLNVHFEWDNRYFFSISPEIYSR